MAVGGVRKGDFETTNEVFTFDERSRKWKWTIPPMPTARNSPGVLNIWSALLVAGGDIASTPGSLSACERSLGSRLVGIIQLML